MKAEIISISNDLLNGVVRDQNVAFLTKELSTMGIEINRSYFVKETKENLRDTIELANENAEIVILVGGLGPNENDITKQTISEYVGMPLVLDRVSEDKIITYHKNSDFRMPDSNQLQALVIQDSIPVRNVTGLAVGMFFEYEHTTYILLPGPFDELKPTFLKNVKSLIIKELLDDAQFATKNLRLFGLSEAEINETLKDFIDHENSPIIGVYKEGEEFEIQITARADHKDEAEKQVEALKEDILNRVQGYVFSEEGQTLLQTVKNLLDENNLTITAAESLTGGEFLSSFSSLDEASSVLSGGIVTYSTEVKNEVLGVSKEVTDKYGVVSPQCAIEMAEKAKTLFDADVAVSLTGVAGPASLEGEIPGTVWIGLAKEGMESFAKEFHFAYKRNKNRKLSVFSAINLVRQIILEEEIEDKVFVDDHPLDKPDAEELQ